MKFRNLITVLGLLLISLFTNKGSASEPPAATTMSNSMIEYVVTDKPYAVLKAAEVTAVVVGNQAVDDAILSGHRGGYNGIASLMANIPSNTHSMAIGYVVWIFGFMGAPPILLW